MNDQPITFYRVANAELSNKVMHHCSECGALVVNTKEHVAFHQTLIDHIKTLLQQPEYKTAYAERVMKRER